MDWDQLEPEARECVRKALGYLNFSSGTPDSLFLGNLNRLLGMIERTGKKGVAKESPAETPAWRTLQTVLRRGVDQLEGRDNAFHSLDQAKAVLTLAGEPLIEGYREYHSDLLFPRSDAFLWNSLAWGRACESVLAEGPPWDETERIVGGAIRRLNNFLGHRPVAVLRTERKIQPYAHEWVRPIPLYVAGAGVAWGRYQDVIEKSLEVLRATDPALLRQAWFDPEMLDELALDPRAYDFDHPVNRRPNYHFGGWDPHSMDQRGYYRRFVVHEVTLEALLSRLDERGDLRGEEVLFEAGGVLAGTMLMGSGVTGDGPSAHDSNTTLSTLLPRVAGYRDDFYEELIQQVGTRHAKRLAGETRALHQPFGGSRQDLNHKLARHRAKQLQHVHVARLFSRMGYTEAATEQTEIVAVASARMRCQIECGLNASHRDADAGRLAEAAERLAEIEDLLLRAIECGALVDPWNALGFGGQFPLFPAVENSVHDHRLDELIELVREIFDLYARLEKEAAASGQTDLRNGLSVNLHRLAQWWDQFAMLEVGEVEGISGIEACESSRCVADALSVWNEAGAGAGDIGFWQSHVDRFESPQAFALSVQTLMDRPDAVASMALLVAWAGNAGEIGLVEGDESFYDLSDRWMELLFQGELDARREGDSEPSAAAAASEHWRLARKFLDYLEANAEEFWSVPHLELFEAIKGGSGDGGGEGDEFDELDELDEEDSLAEDALYEAAYEEVSYRDSTDDGFDAEILDSGPSATDFELLAEAERIVHHLAFLATVARLMRRVAIMARTSGLDKELFGETLAGWQSQLEKNRLELNNLLGAVFRYDIAPPRATHEAMVEYARRQMIKESLLDRIVMASVETGDSVRWLRAARGETGEATSKRATPRRTTSRRSRSKKRIGWETVVQRVLTALLDGRVERVRELWDDLLDELVEEPLLYVPVSRGGPPERVVLSRSIQAVLRRLLTHAPRAGLLTETFRLLGTIHAMERRHPAGPGALTEFDRLFEIGCRGITQAIVDSSKTWSEGDSPDEPDALIECLDEAVEYLEARWLAHSRNIRISILETVSSHGEWEEIVTFIKTYGDGLFTQQFMNFGNLRAILHQGVDTFFDSIIDDPAEYEGSRLCRDLEGRLDRESAVGMMEMILEGVIENYAQYIDYNSTTTQSDRGDMLHTLLDFLRLQAEYDRVAWNFKPMVMIHDVLIRNEQREAAEQWGIGMASRSEAKADELWSNYTECCARYGMRLPSVGDRLGERFVGPMAVQRLLALIGPAVKQRREGQREQAVVELLQGLQPFLDSPSGVGFEVPDWLEALEDEGERAVNRREARGDEDLVIPSTHLGPPRLSFEEIERQVFEWRDHLP